MLNIIRSKSNLLSLSVSFLILLFGLFTFTIVYADAPAGFAQEYGLLVHNHNQDKPISRLQALSSLISYFPESTIDINLKDDRSICSLEFLDCDSHFYGYRNISQKEFLFWFNYFVGMSDCREFAHIDSPTHSDLWHQARINNWLTGSEITYRVFEEFLYRFKVSKTFLGIPYNNSLHLDVKEINTTNYTDIYELPKLQSDIFKYILDLRSSNIKNNNYSKVLNLLNDHYKAYKRLENDINEMNSPLNLIPNLPDDIASIIRENGLNQVLSKIEYNYSNNTPNRKYNVTYGISKLNNVVYMPGETMNFLDVLGDNHWRDYKANWVILRGEEVWANGGGLCGSATMAFSSAWKAGLEIVTRYPHSTFYKNLYPEESFALDATIYANSVKNLRIKNNTESPIMYYSYNDKENETITTYLIGNSPYKKIDIEGPIKTGVNQYKWIRTMTKLDGSIIVDEETTRYSAIK